MPCTMLVIWEGMETGTETLDQRKRYSKSPASFSGHVSELVLQSCRLKDPSARIASILRDNCGRTVVRVRTAESNNAVALLRGLRDVWPLAKISVVENQLDGFVEVQIVIPREEDERSCALKKASSSKFAELLNVVVFILLFVGTALYLKDMYLHKSYVVSNATSATAPAPDSFDREL